MVFKNMSCLMLTTLSFLIFSSFHLNAQQHMDTDTALNGIDMYKYAFKDTSGNEYTFEQFKGKYVYLDIWASWCQPCIKEFPYFDSLKVEYKNKNIEFVQISCDEIRWRWLNGFVWNKRSGHQYMFDNNSPFYADLKIGAIPRYLLIDPNGKLINAYMPKASKPEAKLLLNAILK